MNKIEEVSKIVENKFILSDLFIEKYKKIKPPFGFNGLGELVYLRTYSRIKENGDNEIWWETIRRVVEGCFNMQKKWIEEHRLGWNNRKAQSSAHEMFDRIFNMKFLPPGRGLWAMGSVITEERKLYAALNNCAFVSTSTLKEDYSKPFCFLMDMSMLGVGVGFDTLGTNQIIIKGDNKKDSFLYQIKDDRESWVESIKLLLESYFFNTSKLQFDYSLIRKEGELIKGFGGFSSGSKPLENCHDEIRKVLDKNINKGITTTTIVDIMNLIGKCIVAGNVRRTAEIVFGDSESEEYLDLKNYKVNPHRESYGWTSNNSVFAELGMDYSKAASRTAINGEPGYFWLNNAKNYSRMNDGPDNKDHRVCGGNPCFSAETLIAVADGRQYISIKDLADEGKDVPVYSVNKSGRVDIKWARNPRKTQENVQLVEIEFEEGGKLKLTSNHEMMLLDGTICQAKDLQIGDSLPAFIKKQVKVSKKNKGYYWSVFTDIHNSDKKSFEHRLICKFFDGDNYNRLYDENKQNGWIKGGIVVHHKDYNGLNNSPDNLEWMTFRDHAAMHGSIDNSGYKNPMYGKSHSNETKKLIGQKMLKRCENFEYIKMLSDAQTPELRQKASIRMSESKKEWDKDFYIEQERNTDLNTIWINEKMFAIKNCIICGKEMILEWGKRHCVFCSHSCANKHEDGKIKRINGVRRAYEDLQKEIFHQQIMVYKDLEQQLDRLPYLKEWRQECKNRNLPHRIRHGSRGKLCQNPFVFKSYQELCDKSKNYNHRIKNIKLLEKKEDVYNLTVDDNYTIGVITKINDKSLKGIYLFQCLEQSLESYELCCLVETFPDKHESLDDFIQTLKYAYLYAKTVTLGKTHWSETNRVMLRNRRIGCSMSGIVQFITNKGINKLKEWCERGYQAIEEYDNVYSDWLAIPKSIKKTSIKPSGSVSLLNGSTPGVHFPESRYYIRRIRLSKNSNLIKPLEEAGYKIEACFGSEDNTLVVEIPVSLGNNIRTIEEVSMWEQLILVSFLQKYWADNQVSCTISFKESEAEQIKYALEYFQYQLKGISFLPKFDKKEDKIEEKQKNPYKQMPYQAITKEEYDNIIKNIKHVPKFKKISNEQADVEKFCNNDFCELKV